jgi:hypothetical protein
MLPVINSVPYAKFEQVPRQKMFGELSALMVMFQGLTRLDGALFRRDTRIRPVGMVPDCDKEPKVSGNLRGRCGNEAADTAPMYRQSECPGLERSWHLDRRDRIQTSPMPSDLATAHGCPILGSVQDTSASPTRGRYR